ncbi:MAG: 4-hydroxythreonine-4-phosphate dehydrogenase PdxA [Candidatus Kapabacteria bacterium]|nr:4-hydroxythreonine-4-phosphate dehydrogenase PdxA [Candidatus Kapabacteria bacterium]
MKEIKLISSVGDTNGIGLEIFIKSIQSQSQKYSNISFTLCTNISTLSEYLAKTSTGAWIEGNNLKIDNKIIHLIPCKNYSNIQFGEISESSGRHSVESFNLALEAVINRNYDALLTLPITKKSTYLAGFNFPGHTEAISAKCGSGSHLMILFSKNLRIALVTIHIAISDIKSFFNRNILMTAAVLFHESLQNDFGIKSPKIAVLGLNPHAGESGSMGKEEIEIIIPSILELKNGGIDVSGPFPADGFFGFSDYKKYDGILAMYHDQGLIPLKLLAKGAGVNFTAGLPIVRTSPDHGSALSIAGKNIADPKSTAEAIDEAIRIINNRRIKKNALLSGG